MVILRTLFHMICTLFTKRPEIPTKIVCVHNKKNKKNWFAFICTNPALSEDMIIRVYGKRWQIMPISAFCSICRYFRNANITTYKDKVAIFKMFYRHLFFNPISWPSMMRLQNAAICSLYTLF